MPGGTGGRGASEGFQYQYLRTLEAMLELVEGQIHDIGSVRIDGPANGPRRTTSDDVVDFEFLSDKERCLLVAQVKSGGLTAELSAPAAFDVLRRMLAAKDADAYLLITNIHLNHRVERLQAVLACDDPGGIRTGLQELCAASPNCIRDLATMSDEQVGLLRRCRIISDQRSRLELRDNLRQRLRAYRSRQREGLGWESAGLMTNHLVAEILKRAAGEVGGIFTLDEFRKELQVDSSVLAIALGRWDWGMVLGPFPTVPNIVRKDLLREVNIFFDAPRSGRAVRRCSLVGLSGIGKTSLAALYVLDHADAYDVIFWTTADSWASLVASFQTVNNWLATGSSDAGDEERLLQDRVHAALSTTKLRWLMVFDNAGDASLVEPWIPRLGDGDVLITATDQTSWGLWEQCVQVEAMTDKEAVDLVRLRLRVTDESPSTPGSPSEALLHQLVDQLNRWPLALELACGYFNSCQLTVHDVPLYLERLKVRSLDDNLAVPPGYPRTLVAAIGLAVERIQDLGRASDDPSDAARLAIGLLLTASYFAGRQIPCHLLWASAFLDPDEILDTGLDGPLELDDPTLILEPLRVLRRDSLVRRDKPLCGADLQTCAADHGGGLDETVTINELVQEVLREILDRSGMAPLAISRAAYHTQVWIAHFTDKDEPIQLATLLPHGLALAEHARKLDLQDDCLALLWGNVAVAYQATGLLAEALHLLRQELAYLTQRAAPAPLLLLKVHVGLVDILRQIPGESRDAIAHLQHIYFMACLAATTWPERTADVVANAVVAADALLREKPDHPDVTKLRDVLLDLQERLPMTPVANVTRLAKRLHDMLTDGGSDAEAEDICRLALEAPDLGVQGRRQLAALLVEALALQDKWDEAAAEVQEMIQTVQRSRMYLQPAVTMIHNVGMRVCLLLVNDLAVGSLKLLNALTDLSDLIPEHELFLEADVPPKLKILRAAKALFGDDQLGAQWHLEAASLDGLGRPEDRSLTAWFAICAGLEQRLRRQNQPPRS
jgi:hypothetical protein